jgi:hypothetical protein
MRTKFFLSTGTHDFLGIQANPEYNQVVLQP